MHPQSFDLMAFVNHVLVWKFHDDVVAWLYLQMTCQQSHVLYFAFLTSTIEHETMMLQEVQVNKW